MGAFVSVIKQNEMDAQEQPSVITIEDWLRRTTPPHTQSVRSLPLTFYSKNAFSCVKKSLLEKHWGKSQWFKTWNTEYLCLDSIVYRKDWDRNFFVTRRVRDIVLCLLDVDDHQNKTHTVTDWNVILQTCLTFRFYDLFPRAFDAAIQHYPEHPLLFCVQ